MENKELMRHKIGRPKGVKNKPKPKMGRPALYALKRPMIIEALSKHGKHIIACDQVGLSPTTYATWLKRYPDFALDTQRAKAIAFGTYHQTAAKSPEIAFRMAKTLYPNQYLEEIAPTNQFQILIESPNGEKRQISLVSNPQKQLEPPSIIMPKKTK